LINTLLQIIKAVHTAGTFTVMAAENSGPGGYTVNLPPAIYGKALSVGVLQQPYRSRQTAASG
jgi:hypothetical protein